jgi:hypothetical protein
MKIGKEPGHDPLAGSNVMNVRENRLSKLLILYENLS